MARLIVRRLAVTIPLILLVTFAVFAMVDLSPGDPAAILAGDNPTPEKIAAIRDQLRLDEPLPVRYLDWLAAAVHGDFGISLVTQAEVSSMLLPALPVTLSMAFVAIVMAIVGALITGVWAAVRPGGWVDRGVTALASLAIAVPPFWLGLVLVLLLSIGAGWLPGIGYEPLSAGLWPWLSHLLLPAIALAATPGAELALQLKSSLVDTTGNDYVLTARAKGLTSTQIMLKHSLKNAAIPVVTVLGFRIAQLIGGAVTVEAVFALPGLGQLAVNSVLNRDLPVLLGIVIISALFVMLINLLVDISYGYLNPKVRQT